MWWFAILFLLTVPSLAMAQTTTNPLRLHEAVSSALRNSPALDATHDATVLAEIATRREAAQFGLRLSPTWIGAAGPGGFGRQSVGVTAVKRLATGADVSVILDTQRFGTQAGAFRDAGVMFSLSQPLLPGAWTAATAGLTAAQRSQAASERAHTDARRGVIVAVVEAYFAVVRADHSVAATARLLERAARLRAMADARARIGTATQLDVLRAALLTAQAAASAGGAKEAAGTSRDELNALLGRPVDNAIVLADDALEEAERVLAVPCSVSPASRDTSETAFVTTAMPSRREIAEARDGVAAARLSAAVAHLRLLPPVSLDVSYTRRGFATWGHVADFSNGWRFSISGGHAFDRAGSSAAAEAMDVALRAAERNVRAAEEQVVRDVRRAYRAWQRAAGAVGLQETAAALAEKQLQMTLRRFERGLSDTLELIDAEAGSHQAQLALVDARVGCIVSAVALMRASGVLDPAKFSQ